MGLRQKVADAGTEWGTGKDQVLRQTGGIGAGRRGVRSEESDQGNLAG